MKNRKLILITVLMGLCTEAALVIAFIILRMYGTVQAMEPNPWIATFEILFFAVFTIVSLITWIKLTSQ